MAQEAIHTNSSNKVKDFGQLMKFRLSSLVVFSAITAFIMASEQIDWFKVLMLTLGGFLVTGASNAFNQIIEKDLDKLMERTQTRPMPQDRLSQSESLIFSLFIGATGVFLLWYYMNPLSGMLGIAAMFSYAVIYTPMKRVTPFAVFIGAFPGAIPPMLGWVAATNHLGLEAMILFSIQFIWQFPHFWALAWILDDDYKKAGFRMLPAADGRSKTSALQIAVYTAGLIPIGLLPFVFRMAGPVSAVITSICGIYFMYKALRLLKTCELNDARKLLFASFIYLPVVQLALMFDKM
ncbi:MAG: heme o synthase [Flavobacteriales bacterium]